MKYEYKRCLPPDQYDECRCKSHSLRSLQPGARYKRYNQVEYKRYNQVEDITKKRRQNVIHYFIFQAYIFTSWIKVGKADLKSFCNLFHF